MDTMKARLNTLGIVLAVIGLFFLVGAGFAYGQIQNGYGSLQSFSEAPPRRPRRS